MASFQRKTDTQQEDGYEQEARCELARVVFVRACVRVCFICVHYVCGVCICVMCMYVCVCVCVCVNKRNLLFVCQHKQVHLANQRRFDLSVAD